MKKVSDSLAKLVGRMVAVEGTFPIPLPTGQVAYAPARGVLKAVYEDGFELQDTNDPEPSVFFFVNVRSVTPFNEATTKPQGRILKLQ